MNAGALTHAFAGPLEHNPETPFVSVILPVRNEEAYIVDCLMALAAQTYPRQSFEVIVLDGESTDGTLRAAEQTAREHGMPDAFLTNHKRTTASGLNLGLSLARGEVFIHLDGHTRVEPEFIAASVRALQESGADAVGGPIRTLGRGAIGRAIALAMASPFGVGDAAFRTSEQAQWADTAPFAAYRRNVFERLGGFSEQIDRGEDDEFNYRLRDGGGRIWLTPSIHTDYYARRHYWALARQYWGYGIAKVAVLRLHPSRLRARHLIPPAFVLTLAGGAALSLFDGRFLWLTAVAGAAYAAATLLASLSIAMRGHWAALPYLPLAFTSIHLAAGAGMLAGALQLLRPRRRPRG